MTFLRDRSNEFKSIVIARHSRQKTQSALGVRQTDGDGNQSYFKKSTKTLTTAIHNTQIKLESLKKLCNSRLLVKENSSNTNALIMVVKQDVDSLRKQISLLNELQKDGRIPHVSIQEKNHQIIVILSLETLLAKISAEFKCALEMRSQNLKYMQRRVDSLLPRSGESFSFVNESNTPTDEASLLNFPSTQQLFPEHQQNSLLLDMQQQQQQQSTSHKYMSERVNSMQNIESTIVELSEIFQQLSTYVHQQEEQIHLIDTNIEAAEMQVDAAHSELLKYFKSINSNRWLIIKVFAILFLFFIMFAVLT